MKVLHVIPALGPVYGGPSLSVLDLAKAIAHTGIHVDIVTTNANGSNCLDVPLQTWIEQDGVRIQYFPYWYFKDYKISLPMGRWLSHHIADYDIVNTHAIFSYTNVSAYRSCQRHGIPYVIHPHGMLEPWAIAYKSWKKKAYYSLFEKPALEKASVIRALVTSEALHIQELNLRTPLAITPNGITQQSSPNPSEVEAFYEQFPSTRGKTLILFLGRIDPKKGLDLLATAFGQVHQQFPQAHLVVAGPDNIGFLPTVQSFFERENCLNAVTFTGMLMGAAKAAALTVADLYVAPSYSEGFSMSVLEGMGAGLPCIITTGCNFPEAAAAEVAHVVEIDAAAIAQAITSCLKHPEAAKAMGDRARQFIFDHYTWNQIASRLIQVYNDILRRGASKVTPLVQTTAPTR